MVPSVLLSANSSTPALSHAWALAGMAVPDDLAAPGDTLNEATGQVGCLSAITLALCCEHAAPLPTHWHLRSLLLDLLPAGCICFSAPAASHQGLPRAL